MLDRLDALPDQQLQDMVRQSYEMVAAKAPKKPTRRRSQPRTKPRPKTRVQLAAGRTAPQRTRRG
jgi:hypothetical protein